MQMGYGRKRFGSLWCIPPPLGTPPLPSLFPSPRHAVPFHTIPSPCHHAPAHDSVRLFNQLKSRKLAFWWSKRRNALLMDGPRDARPQGWTGGQNLLSRCEDASKKRFLCKIWMDQKIASTLSHFNTVAAIYSGCSVKARNLSTARIFQFKEFFEALSDSKYWRTKSPIVWRFHCVKRFDIPNHS